MRRIADRFALTATR